MTVVFLLDLDNTLIDNDAVRERLNAGTRRLLGAVLADRFWKIYEEVRDECDYVDFLETLSRFHRIAKDPSDQQRQLDRLILDFPYAEARYPATLDVLAALWNSGTPVVLSDGDPVFQPLKVFRSGVADAVRGNVLVFPHKETCLDAVERLFPADDYVAVDDKAAILALLKTQWGERLTTVHVLQGKYADDAYTGPPQTTC
ncbi:MAG: HAD family hydrolase [Chloroflexota bacterium]|nr:HAD family hydrolase [Chloroflexota bacterium]